ncbi:hypothetical protein HKBW3S03_00736, partial [Candidatus Hakubella thermalkaliphila]
MDSMVKIVNYPFLAEGASWAECLLATHISTGVSFRSSCGTYDNNNMELGKNQEAASHSLPYGRGILG